MLRFWGADSEVNDQLVPRLAAATRRRIVLLVLAAAFLFQVSPLHGGLAAASDAEVLTFIDLRTM